MLVYTFSFSFSGGQGKGIIWAQKMEISLGSKEISSQQNKAKQINN